MRDFLLFVSGNRGASCAELRGTTRNYDVAYNDYTENDEAPSTVEYRCSSDVSKFRAMKMNLADVVFNYQVVALWDDDVEASTATINALFTAGVAEGLCAWQAALSPDSCSSWGHLYQRPPTGRIRRTNMLELMMPFFTRDALKVVWETFDKNESAWGIETIWTCMLGEKNLGIFDSLPVRHMRPIKCGPRVMKNGLTSHEEADLIRRQYGVTVPRIY